MKFLNSIFSVFLSNKVRNHIAKNQLQLDWINTLFVLSFLLIGCVGVPLFYLAGNEIHLGPWALAFTTYWIMGIGITMGYHRLFSHRTYEAANWVQALLLIAGSGALQNSALKWSADHRKHHSFTDTEKDPYNAKLGFLWSHVLWIFFSDPAEKALRFSGASNEARLLQQFPQCRDLVKNPLVRLQHRISIPFGILFGFGIPLAFGIHYNMVLEYVLVAGFLRTTLVHNSTFFINSLAHIWGTQPHSDKDTARDSVAMAFLALGEGYHNYHHSFPNDYRNGTQALHFDSTKWLIYGFSKVGATWNLKRSNLQKNSADTVSQELLNRLSAEKVYSLHPVKDPLDFPSKISV